MIGTDVQVAKWLLVSLCYSSSHRHQTYLGTHYLIFVPVVWEMGSTGFSNTNVQGCNLCHLWHYFIVVYLTSHCVVNITICKMLCWFINNNLKQSTRIRSCFISGVLLRQPEKSCTIVINVAVVQVVIPMLSVHS